MSKKKGFLESRGFKILMKYVYGIGAAIVIGGALFKIMHWPGANEMLIAGMGTEVLVFFVSAFEPLHEELDWVRVYPQLADDPDEEFTFEDETDSLSPEEAMALAEDKMKQIELTPDLFDSLSGSLNGLKDNVTKLSTIQDASVATNEYAENVKAASSKMGAMNENYTKSVEAMDALSSSVTSAANDSKAYNEQVQAVTKNLASLNAVYEMELQDAQNHIKSLNQFYGSLSSAMSNMMEVADGAQEYKNQVAGLTQNLRKLNSIYGGMISAMGGGVGNTGGDA